MPQITFNGKTYNSLEEMPANDRQAYEQMMGMFVDKNGNGIPDFLEGDMVKNVLSAYSTKVYGTDKTYNSLDEMPPELRQSVDSAFKMLSSMGIVPQDSDQDHGTEHHIHNDEYVQSTKFVSREYKPVIEEEKGTNPLLWLLIGGSVALCVGAAAIIFLLM